MTFSDHVFQSELFKSTYRSFVASQQEKHDAGKVNVLLSLSQKLLKKKFFFAKMAIFRVFVLCRPNCWSLRSSQFCDLSIISQWEKNERRLFCTKTIQNTLKHRVTGGIDTLSRNIVTGDPASCHQGHGRSPAVYRVQLLIDQLERWKHHRCVQPDNADRLICNMTFSGQVMTWTWGQIFNMTFQGQMIIHSTRLDERNTMLVKESSCKVWVKSYCRKLFQKKSAILAVFAPWRQNRWR